MEITVKRSFDRDEILSVLTNPVILKTITEGDASEISVEPEAVCFITAYVDGELSACFIFNRLSNVVCDIHAHILPAKRPQSKDIGAAILRHFFDIAPWANKLTAIIPSCYPNVIKYALSFGFQIEGINRASYVFGNQIQNITVTLITGC
jgi:hypothetical protein